MKIEKSINPKARRKLIYDWQILVRPSNYTIPETIAERKSFDIWAPKIAIDSIECFFNDKAKEALKDFSDTLYQCNEIREIASYNLIYKTVISFAEQNVIDQVKHQVTTQPLKDIENIINTIKSKCGQYHFVRVLDGLSLVGIERVPLGEVEIFIFSKSHENDMQEYRDANNENGFYDNIITPFVKSHLLNKVCIKATAYGDADIAEEIANRKLKQAINVIRFIFCIYGYNRVHERLIKINLLSESFNVSERNLKINRDNKIITLTGDSRKALQSFDIDLTLLNELREFYFYDAWIDFIAREKKTEIEESILTSIYWIGEAQNDYIPESAFIKYWTALETFFSISDEHREVNNIVEQLARGISCLLALGGYQFVKVDDIGETYKRVKSLYIKRSKIIHRGIYAHINPIDLGEICKYSVWCTLTCIGLRSIGYRMLDQIKHETNRLFVLRRR